MFARKPFIRPPRAPVGRIEHQRGVMGGALGEPAPKPPEPVRSEDYRRFVASQACFGCGIDGFSQCAHANAGKGMSLKTCDLMTFPLCGPHFGFIGCHQAHDLGIDMTRAERRLLEIKYVARMQAIARDAGRKEFA